MFFGRPGLTPFNRGRASGLKLRYSNHASNFMVNPSITDFGYRFLRFLRKLETRIRYIPDSGFVESR